MGSCSLTGAEFQFCKMKRIVEMGYMSTWMYLIILQSYALQMGHVMLHFFPPTIKQKYYLDQKKKSRENENSQIMGHDVLCVVCVWMHTLMYCITLTGVWDETVDGGSSSLILKGGGGGLSSFWRLCQLLQIQKCTLDLKTVACVPFWTLSKHLLMSPKCVFLENV